MQKAEYRLQGAEEEIVRAESRGLRRRLLEQSPVSLQMDFSMFSTWSGGCDLLCDLNSLSDRPYLNTHENMYISN